MLVVGTAGHIDHGKTRLVGMLTGRDLDTLPEERARGITIALGFAPLALPGGRQASLVDVPGHERLIRTMVAGASGLDAALLVVSAVEGVMPQTREHLDILGLLGVDRGVVALTMADLVDDELLELATEDVRDAVRGTFLDGAPLIPTSAVDGRGRDALVAALAALEPRPGPTSGPFRLPVDRAFSLAGHGTIVTGTTWSGQLRVGDQVTLLPSDLRARVRSLQIHNAPGERAGPRQRVAINLAGVDVEQVPRGTTVALGPVPCPRMIDVIYEHLPSAPPLPDGAPVRLLLGTAEVMGRLHLAADRDTIEPGATVPAQLRLDAPCPCGPGDRFVLRRASPLQTLGGGVVADPYTRRMRRRERVAWGHQTAALAAGDRGVWLLRAGDRGLDRADWIARGGADEGVALGDRVVAPPTLGRLQGTLLEALRAFHEAHPLDAGANRRALHQAHLPHLEARAFDALVDSLAGAGLVVADGALIRLPAFHLQLDAAHERLREALLAELDAAGAAGATTASLRAAVPHPDVPALLHALERRGELRAVDGVGWVLPQAVDGLTAAVRAWFTDHPTLTPGDFKELTGQSRRTAIPWLEWLDAHGLTRFAEGGQRQAGPAL